MVSLLGYRDEYLFGDEVTAPVEVTSYETFVLGNTNIPYTLIKRHAAKLSAEERDALARICNYREDRPSDEALLRSAVKKVLGGRDFCKWLCATPSDVVMSYMAPYYDASERVEGSFCSAYEIPADAIALTETGDPDGTLWTWHATPENVTPVWEVPMRDALARERASVVNQATVHGRCRL